MKTEKHDWYAQMVRKLQINGKSKQTVQAYTRAVHQLTKHYQRDPKLITEEELETYFLYRRNESEWAPKTLMDHLIWTLLESVFQLIIER